MHTTELKPPTRLPYRILSMLFRQVLYAERGRKRREWRFWLIRIYIAVVLGYVVCGTVSASINNLFCCCVVYGMTRRTYLVIVLLIVQTSANRFLLSHTSARISEKAYLTKVRREADFGTSSIFCSRWKIILLPSKLADSAGRLWPRDPIKNFLESNILEYFVTRKRKTLKNDVVVYIYLENPINQTKSVTTRDNKRYGCSL